MLFDFQIVMFWVFYSKVKQPLGSQAELMYANTGFVRGMQIGGWGTVTPTWGVSAMRVVTSFVNKGIKLIALWSYNGGISYI